MSVCWSRTWQPSYPVACAGKKYIRCPWVAKHFQQFGYSRYEDYSAPFTNVMCKGSSPGKNPKETVGVVRFCNNSEHEGLSMAQCKFHCLTISRPPAAILVWILPWTTRRLFSAFILTLTWSLLCTSTWMCRPLGFGLPRVLSRVGPIQDYSQIFDLSKDL